LLSFELCYEAGALVADSDGLNFSVPITDDYAIAYLPFCETSTTSHFDAPISADLSAAGHVRTI
jgi:hypothetical protein